jgi:glutamate-1-semialdehyde 2,1-aminomutase
MVSEEAVLLAEKIAQLVPCAEQVCLHSTGTDSTFFALRFARAYRGRDKILKFEGGYHGMSDYALMSTQWTFQPANYPDPVPNSAGIPGAVADNVLVAPFNDLDKTAEILDRHRDELAAVIVEPMQRTFVPLPGFLEGLRERCTAHDIPLIFDEVVTGFRLALGGAQERYGVKPDLCALGKSISGGHPIGVLCGRADILGLADPANAAKGGLVMQTGTFSHNPISAAAALACIDVLTKPGVYEQLEARGGRLKQGVADALKDAGVEVCVSGEPSAFQPWFTSETVIDHKTALTADFAANAKFTEALLDRGVVKAHEKFFVSLAHSEQDIDDTLAAVREAADVMAGA